MQEVCKPPKGAVFKRYGTERSGKGSVKDQVSVKKLNASEPLKKCRKRILVVKTVVFIAMKDNCKRKTVYWLQPTGIKRQELYTGFYTKRERLAC